LVCQPPSGSVDDSTSWHAAGGAIFAQQSGLHGLTRALAVELGPKGVNVNCIGPGFYPGVQNEVVRRNKQFYDWIAGRSPLGRWGDPSELGGAVIYFASPASSFCNGQVLMVDGGMTIAL
jgi:gluconate 5-dehydrogenase